MPLVLVDALPSAVLAFVLIGRPEFKIVDSRASTDADRQGIGIAVEIAPAPAGFQNRIRLAWYIANSNVLVMTCQITYLAGCAL